MRLSICRQLVSVTNFLNSDDSNVYFFLSYLTHFILFCCPCKQSFSLEKRWFKRDTCYLRFCWKDARYSFEMCIKLIGWLTGYSFTPYRQYFSLDWYIILLKCFSWYYSFIDINYLFVNEIRIYFKNKYFFPKAIHIHLHCHDISRLFYFYYLDLYSNLHFVFILFTIIIKFKHEIWIVKQRITLGWRLLQFSCMILYPWMFKIAKFFSCIFCVHIPVYVVLSNSPSCLCRILKDFSIINLKALALLNKLSIFKTLEWLSDHLW